MTSRSGEHETSPRERDHLFFRQRDSMGIKRLIIGSGGDMVLSNRREESFLFELPERWSWAY